MIRDLIRLGKQGAGHGLYFSKRYKLAIKFLRAGLKNADEWEVPLVMASLGGSLFHVGEYIEAKKCLELVVKDAVANPDSWTDDYSLEVLHETSNYLDQIENLIWT